VALGGLDFPGRDDDAGSPGAEAAAPGPGANLEARLKEVGAIFNRIQGPAELARWLELQGEPLWLQDHPWLRAVAPELRALGLSPQFPDTEWGPAGETAVIIGLGVIPESGSVLIEAASGSAAALAFRVRRLVVIVPADQADLSLAQALKLTAGQAPMVTWLTGPSRTTDIEKVLVRGAQGPQELHIVLYQAEE
jgi:L-lactate dehydrogenase complex protein LldG